MEVTRDKDMSPFTATTKEYHTVEAMNAAILKTFKAKGQSQPFLLFDSAKDEDLWDALTAYGNTADITCTKCDTMDDAKIFKSSLSLMKKGLIRMDNKFSVGIDIKLASDAHVMLKLNEPGDMTMQDVYQIFGRGCRSQGHGVGTIYVLRSTKGSVWQQIVGADDLRSL